MTGMNFEIYRRFIIITMVPSVFSLATMVCKYLCDGTYGRDMVVL